MRPTERPPPEGVSLPEHCQSPRHPTPHSQMLFSEWHPHHPPAKGRSQGEGCPLVSQLGLPRGAGFGRRRWGVRPEGALPDPARSLPPPEQRGLHSLPYTRRHSAAHAGGMGGSPTTELLGPPGHGAKPDSRTRLICTIHHVQRTTTPL